jgi:Zn-dependent M28 family amino/carboxypeptidase
MIEGWVSRELAVDMFRAAGRDFAREKDGAASRDFRPFELSNTTLSTRFRLKRTSLVSHNVIGRISGSSPRRESVIYSAHWDHLGTGDPDETGDRVYHGAQDNASGVAGLIELGRRFARAPRPRRSILFLATTGEEKGLLGATYYTLHPAMPLAGTVADLNLDALDTKGPTHDISLWGLGRASLERDVAELARHRGRVLATNPRFDGGYYFRADHFAFSRAGVPAITLGSGVNLVDGGPVKGRAEVEEYYTTRYHRPGDRWTPSLDFSGQADDLDFYYALGRPLADGAARPGFDPKSDFRTAQDRLRATNP